MSASLLAAVGCFVVLGVRLVIAGLSRDTSMQRVVLATALAVGGAWSSVAWNTGCVEGVPVRSWSTWRSERFLSATSYETLVVGGWPLQRVEGHGRGGAPQRLMPGKGLAAMQANTAAWFAAVLLLTMAISSAWLPVMCVFSLMVGAAGYGVGFVRVLWMLD